MLTYLSVAKCPTKISKCRLLLYNVGIVNKQFLTRGIVIELFFLWCSILSKYLEKNVPWEVIIISSLRSRKDLNGVNLFKITKLEYTAVYQKMPPF